MRVAWSTVRRAVARTSRSPVRRLSYAPELDGSADPGEVVWAMVAYEDDPRRAKDRPVLVVGWRDARTVLALMLSSRGHRSDDRTWLALGRGAWDGRRRRSFVRLDRVLELDQDGLRREGAVLRQDQFERVCAELRSRYGWS